MYTLRGEDVKPVPHILRKIRASDITPESWPPAQWLLSRPRLVDALIIALCIAPQLLALSLSDGEQPITSWIAVVFAGTTLWFRRHHAFWVIIALSAISCIHPETTLIAAFAFTGYKLASSGPFSRTLVGVLASFIIASTGTFTRFLVTGESYFPKTVTDAIVLMALGLGLAAKGRKDRRAAVAEIIAQKIENARQLERNRIAVEMHDVVAHSLSVIIALANGAAATRIRDPEQSAIALEHLASTSRNALIEMQTVIGVLRTSDQKLDDDLDVSGHNVPELEQLVEVFQAAHLPVIFIREGSETGLPPNLRTAIYRISQESLTNALRYAEGASKVEIRLTISHDQILLSIKDDGHAHNSFTDGSGQGIIGIRERATLLGGFANAGPRVQGGWQVKATLPHQESLEV